jgi:signal transduction histidine kinase
VRLRTAGVAVMVVTVVLIIAAGILLAALRSELAGAVRESARLRAGDVAAALNSGTPPRILSVSDDEDLIQVIDADGAVVASSKNVRGRPPVARLKPGEAKSVRHLPGVTGRLHFLIVATGARVDRRPVTVLVARESEIIHSSTTFLTDAFLVGIPLLALLVGATTWWLTGRALAPVDAIRTEVDEISGSQLHRRVPEPLSSDEVGRLAVTMNRMLERVELAAGAQRQFASDASHELRSPVATIRQHAEVALAHPERTTTAELAAVVLTEDLRVQRLVEDLLLLARTGEGGMAHRGHAVDLDDVVFDEASRIRSTSKLRVDLGAVSAGRVVGEETHLRRLVRNLVDNAIRHATSQIRLSLATDDRTVTLRVEDDGAGVAAADRGRIFERFVRLDEARSRDDGGSGLGLAIVADIAIHNGGTVGLATSDLGGAAFTVTLPAAVEPR